jgi:hypothetical protein
LFHPERLHREAASRSQCVIPPAFASTLSAWVKFCGLRPNFTLAPSAETASMASAQAAVEMNLATAKEAKAILTARESYKTGAI